MGRLGTAVCVSVMAQGMPREPVHIPCGCDCEGTLEEIHMEPGV